MARDWSPYTESTLSAAGWYDGRDVSTEVAKWLVELGSEFETFQKAESILHQFGGIAVRQTGPGRDVARTSFILDPRLAEGEGDRFATFERLVRSRLFPLGEAGDGHFFLAASETGAVYLIMEHIRYLGATIYEALNSLVEGIRVEPPGNNDSARVSAGTTGCEAE